MKKVSKYLVALLFILGLNIGASFLLEFQTLDLNGVNLVKQKEFSDTLRTSNSGNKNVIVFFNNTNYNNSAKIRFVSYGGILKENEDWNGLFIEFSGFAGTIPLVNLSSYESEFPDINIDTDEIIEVQMNYASVQTQSINATWYNNGYNGDTNSSIAVLDSGINPNQVFLQDKVVGWQNFVDNDLISDRNGHGTFISSVIAGTGVLTNESSSPSFINLYGNYTHLELFEDYLPSKNYTFKILTVNMSKSSTKIGINSSFDYQTNEIDTFWLELFYNSTLVNSSTIQNPNQIYSIIHDVAPDKRGIYDVYVKYHKKSNTTPAFSFNSSMSFFPESYYEDYNHFNGIANATKILSYRVVNSSGQGHVSDLISAMASVIQNRAIYQIISVCLSIGTIGEDVTAINTVIDEVIKNHIIVVIAAGNNGIEGSKPFNSLGINKNAIVVGAINDEDMITSYSSMGRNVGENVLKPDIVAPGGSTIQGHRSIVSADGKSNDTTTLIGTSISTAIVSAVINILIDAKWGSWTEWNNQNLTKWVKMLKAVLLMTASETNLEREDDPKTEIDESDYSPNLFNGLLNNLKDVHEGYGRLNIQAAIDALTKEIEINEPINYELTSSELNPLENHVFARKIHLLEDTQYSFNLSNVDGNADLDLFLYANESNRFGEPLLLQAAQKWYGDSDFFYFTPKHNQTECIVIVKAISGKSNFTLNVSSVNNNFAPELKMTEINYFGGVKNDTVISLQEFYGSEPAKNYTIDNYWFFIEYFDNDTSNVPPQEVYLYIVNTSKKYAMTQILAFDGNYTNGAVFRSDFVKFSKPGKYYYYFNASDGSHHAKYPLSELSSINIEFPDDSEAFPYAHDFNDGLNGWSYNGTGWGMLNQSNQNDNRSTLYSENWSAMYFGRDHDFPLNYTYQPYIITNPFPNGSLRSPLFNITDINKNYTQVFAKIGLRTSLNSGDFMYLQINPNWTGWITLRTYSGEERDWFLEEINITQYIGNFVQFRFVAVIDEDFDPINYKGFALAYFSLENYTNFQTPEIDFNVDDNISDIQGFKYDRIAFSLNYFDSDNNYPEYVFIEINNQNYSMINIFGAWNASLSSVDSRGIKFVKSFVLNDITNLTFRFHVYDGKFFNSTNYFNQDHNLFNFQNPIAYEFNVNQSGKLIGFDYTLTSLSEYYITGNPMQKELTQWLKGDNSWHLYYRFGNPFIYGGLGQSYGSLSQGYGPEWEASLITYPLHVRDEYDVFLNFAYEISLQNEFFLEQDELDKCTISISSDYGESWDNLREYYFDSENLAGNESVDISQYSNEIVLIKFTLHSNDITTGLGYGWLISNIYLGYDKSTDFIAPTIEISTPLSDAIINSITKIEANISDNIEIDDTRINIYINDEMIDRSLLNFNQGTGVLSFEWDTSQFLDGTYVVMVVAYDAEGNRAESVVHVEVENGLMNFQTWGIWLLIIVSVIILGIISYVLAEKYGKFSFRHRRNTFAEKLRLKEFDKDQVIKRIEIIETSEEYKNPLILHCKYCQSWFESSKFNYMCPKCDHDQIYVAYNCINCGKWYFKDKPEDNFYCKNKKCRGVRLVRREIEEIKESLKEKGIFLRKFENKSKKFSILDR